MSKRNGLTLIELLVTMSILALLILILYSVFNISLRGWKKSDSVLEASTIARVVIERMSREISGAIIDGGNNFYCLGFDQAAPSTWHADNQADEFYFIAPINPGDSEYSDLCEVGYWLGLDNDGKKVLKRFYAVDDRKEHPANPNFDFDFSTPAGNNDEFSQNISNLEFEFFDKTGASLVPPVDSRPPPLGKGSAPAKIKVTITVEVGKGSKDTNPDFLSKSFSFFVSLLQ